LSFYFKNESFVCRFYKTPQKYHKNKLDYCLSDNPKIINTIACDYENPAVPAASRIDVSRGECADKGRGAGLPLSVLIRFFRCSGS
jgi:hypothetical protein